MKPYGSGFIQDYSYERNKWTKIKIGFYYENDQDKLYMNKYSILYINEYVYFPIFHNGFRIKSYI